MSESTSQRRLSTRRTKPTPTCSGATRPYVEEMYENYLANPGSVPDNWRDYFDALAARSRRGRLNAKDVPHLPVINAFAERAKQGGTKVVLASADAEDGAQAHCCPAADRRLPQRRRSAGPTWTR